MTLAVLQAVVLCTFAYVQINEGLTQQHVNVRDNTPVTNVNITSLGFLAPLKKTWSRYSTIIKDFLQKKFNEFKIIASGLLASFDSSNFGAGARPPGAPVGAGARPLGAPVMQVTRPLLGGLKPLTAPTHPLAPVNETKT